MNTRCMLLQLLHSVIMNSETSLSLRSCASQPVFTWKKPCGVVVVATAALGLKEGIMMMLTAPLVEVATPLFMQRKVPLIITTCAVTTPNKKVNSVVKKIVGFIFFWV